MTPPAELVARLRDGARIARSCDGDDGFYDATADALESQEKRIAELEKSRDHWYEQAMCGRNERAEKAEARVAELELENTRFRVALVDGEQEIAKAEADLAAANARVEELRKALIASKISHTVVEDDCWYSCPKSGRCCNENTKPHDYCNCGADAHNAAIDAAIAALGGSREMGS